MKKYTFRFIIVCLLCLALIPVTGCGGKSARRAKTDKSSAQSSNITGEVIAVDVNAGTITVKGFDSETVIIVDGSTKITSKKTTRTLADIKNGNMIRIIYVESDGKMTAKSIKIR